MNSRLLNFTLELRFTTVPNHFSRLAGSLSLATRRLQNPESRLPERESLKRIRKRSIVRVHRLGVSGNRSKRSNFIASWVCTRQPDVNATTGSKGHGRPSSGSKGASISIATTSISFCFRTLWAALLVTPSIASLP